MFVPPQVQGSENENVGVEVCNVTAVPGTVGATKINQPV